MPLFTGFSSETFSFLAGLGYHNERSWFEEHKSEYERFVVNPALALIAEMDSVVKAISPHYRGVPKKMGGSLMRIYRDTRFSRDKTPYKTNIGIQFRHESAKDVHAPGWYVHLDLSSCFMGAGTWHPEPDDLNRLRQAIAEKPESYSRALEETKESGMTLGGESLVKMPRGYDPAHPLAAEIRRKDFILTTDLDPALYMSHDLIEVLEVKFRATAPFMAWMCRALGAPF